MLALLNIDGTTEPKPDPRRHLISIFNKFYVENTAKRNPINFGWMMKMMETRFVTVDEPTGECFIEYPDEQTWNEQVKGFFDDDFAWINRNYHFSYLMKQYGSFAKVEKIKQAKTDKALSEQFYFCEKCKANHRADQTCPMC